MMNPHVRLLVGPSIVSSWLVGRYVTISFRSTVQGQNFKEFRSLLYDFSKVISFLYVGIDG